MFFVHSLTEADSHKFRAMSSRYAFYTPAPSAHLALPRESGNLEFRSSIAASPSKDPGFREFGLFEIEGGVCVHSCRDFLRFF